MNKLAVVVVAAVLALAGCGAAARKVTAPSSTTSAASSSASCDATCQAVRSIEATPINASSSDQYMTPVAADFEVDLKILSKQCFGSAGCDIEYRPTLSMLLAPGSLDPAVTYDVTYVVKGDTSGPITDTITVTGDQYDEPDSNVVQTASQRTKLVATVTGVSPE